MYSLYWKRGWWCLAMLLCQALIIAVVTLPIGMIFKEAGAAHYITRLVVFLLVELPVLGFFFEYFARNSARIGPLGGFEEYHR